MHSLTKQRSYSHSRKLVRKKFSLFSLLVFSCCIQVNAWAAVGADEAITITQLDKIENKLFQHNYPKDSTDIRLGRAENFIFGENKKGSTEERLSALVKAVPNLDSPPTDNSLSSEAATADNSASTDSTDKHTPIQSKEVSNDNTDTGESPGNYPAITAMEAKLLGKDYSKEPVKDRLARLEKKTLGAVSTSSDLSERVDKLKEATGIDVARKSNSLSDWMEEGDEVVTHAPSSRGVDPSFGSRDIYQDMQKSRPPRNAYSSAYIPDQASRGPGISIKSFGLSQQVLALEHEIFAKSYEHDPLPARLNRLEASVFPGQKPNTDMSLPQRVQTLLAKVPIPQQELRSLAETYQIDPGTSMANADSFGNSSNMPKQHGNLSKIINSLGNMLSGGMAGGFPMSSGNYMLDPTTGMFIDPNTGYMINPNSGTAYGGRPNYPSYGSGSYGFNSFGASPFGGPGLGMGSGIGPGFGSGFGFGGSGMGFGFR